MTSKLRTTRRVVLLFIGARRGLDPPVSSLRPDRSIELALPPVPSGFSACVIRVDDALGGAARCRHIALCQRGVTAFEVIVVPALIDLQADRITRIIGLRLSRWYRRSRCDCHKCHSQNAHK